MTALEETIDLVEEEIKSARIKFEEDIKKLMDTMENPAEAIALFYFETLYSHVSTFENNKVSYILVWVIKGRDKFKLGQSLMPTMPEAM